MAVVKEDYLFGSYYYVMLGEIWAYLQWEERLAVLTNFSLSAQLLILLNFGEDNAPLEI